jgi:WD40 repeat protein
MLAVSSQYKGKVTVFNNNDSFDEIAVFENHHAAANNREVYIELCFAWDNTKLGGGAYNGRITVWSLDEDNKRELFTQKPYDCSIYCLCFSGDGTRLAAGFQNESAVVCDAESGVILFQLANKLSHTCKVGFINRDGNKLLTCSLEDQLEVWDTETGLKTGSVNCGGLRSAHIVLNRYCTKLAAADLDGGLCIWKIDADTAAQSLELDSAGFAAVMSFDESGNMLTTWSWVCKQIRVWDVTKGFTVHMFHLESVQPNCCVYSGGGERAHVAAAITGSSVVIFDARTGNKIQSLVTADFCCYCVCYSHPVVVLL